MTNDEILAKVPLPPEGSSFSVEGVRDVTVPHPYCLTPRHVTWASKYNVGMLDSYAIESAEKAGARCDTCKGQLKYKDHIPEKALVIVVPSNDDLSLVSGLHSYLLFIKKRVVGLGITGIMFPTPGQLGED